MKYPNAKNWHGFYAFACSVVIASTLWNVIVNYPVHHFQQNVSYENILNFLEKEHGIKFDPYQEKIRNSGHGLSRETFRDGGLALCGEGCLKNFRDLGVTQKLYVSLSGGSSSSYYEQYYEFVGEQIVIVTKNIARLPKFQEKIDIRDYLFNAVLCEKMCKNFGVKYRIYFSTSKSKFISATILMDKIGSWLDGFDDDEFGGRDREHVLNFNWLDVMRARSEKISKREYNVR